MTKLFLKIKSHYFEKKDNIGVLTNFWRRKKYRFYLNVISHLLWTPLTKNILLGTPSQNIRIFKKNWIPILSNVDRFINLGLSDVGLEGKNYFWSAVLTERSRVIFLFT